MRKNEELARGLLKGVDGRVRSKRLWENLCDSLNSMGSCAKSVEQWQRVWALAKKAARAARRSACASGGGPSVAPTLSQMQLKILTIMGEALEESQTKSRVPAFPTGPPVREPAAISPTHAATPADPVFQTQPSTCTEASAAPVPQWSPRGVATQELPMHNQRTLNRRRPHRRVRRHLAADSVRSRIVEVEEQRLLIATRRNEVLSEIKLAIQELCTLVREHMTRNS